MRDTVQEIAQDRDRLAAGVGPPRTSESFSRSRANGLAFLDYESKNARMIGRLQRSRVLVGIDSTPVVAILGPRQVGKTTLALEIASGTPSVYLDLEDDADRARLADPGWYLREHPEELLVLDEIHRVPDLFRTLRGVVDERRRAGRRSAQYLILGSAGIDLLRQSGESLAGRIAYFELCPFNALEIASRAGEGEQSRGVDAGRALDRLWLRGGFPDSWSAKDDRASLAWRTNFVRTYLQRDIPEFGPRIPAETLRRFWTMLAHLSGGLLNAAALSRSLGVDNKTVAKYLDLMVDLLLVRRLQPWHRNVGKRLVKSPRVYLRDSGLLHALLGIGSIDDLAGHPKLGESWEGFVVENVLSALPDGAGRASTGRPPVPRSIWCSSSEESAGRSRSSARARRRSAAASSVPATTSTPRSASSCTRARKPSGCATVSRRGRCRTCCTSSSGDAHDRSHRARVLATRSVRARWRSCTGSSPGTRTPTRTSRSPSSTGGSASSTRSGPQGRGQKPFVVPVPGRT